VIESAYPTTAAATIRKLGRTIHEPELGVRAATITERNPEWAARIRDLLVALAGHAGWSETGSR